MICQHAAPDPRRLRAEQAAEPAGGSWPRPRPVPGPRLRWHTVAAVAQAAGVSPATIYVSLGGKQGLLEGVLSLARSDPADPAQRDQQDRRDEVAALADPHQRLRRLVELSCETLARISPVHAVLRGAADGHPFAAGLSARMLRLRLQIQAGNTGELPRRRVAARPDRQAGRRTLQRPLSPEFYHLLTVGARWTTRRYAGWVAADRSTKTPRPPTRDV